MLKLKKKSSNIFYTFFQKSFRWKFPKTALNHVTSIPVTRAISTAILQISVSTIRDCLHFFTFTRFLPSFLKVQRNSSVLRCHVLQRDAVARGPMSGHIPPLKVNSFIIALLSLRTVLCNP